MWDLPGSRIEPTSSALAGRFFTTEPPGKPSGNYLFPKPFFTFICPTSHVGSWFRHQKLNWHPLHWKLRVLMTGPSGKSLQSFFSTLLYFLLFCNFWTYQQKLSCWGWGIVLQPQLHPGTWSINSSGTVAKEGKGRHSSGRWNSLTKRQRRNEPGMLGDESGCHQGSLGEESGRWSWTGRAGWVGRMCVCVLCRFSHVQVFATVWTVTHQSPLSMEFPR